MIKNKLTKSALLSAMTAVAVLGTGILTFADVASAATSTPSVVSGTVTSPITGTTGQAGRHGFGSFGKGSGVAGTVTAINGMSITLTGKNSTTYTVDASNAKIMKISAPAASSGTTPATRPTPTTITVANIAVGDTLMVRGTVSGTSVTATNIIDGKFGGFAGRGGAHGASGTQSGTASPHVGGTVTAVNGNSITVTETPKSGTPVVYTVDVSSATITQRGTKGTTPGTLTASAITVGERVMVRGTVSGTSVTATNVTVMPARTATASTATATQ